jgi:predicted site-specific integrase-resolvase
MPKFWDMPTPDLVGLREAAEILNVDRSTLFRWVQLGKVEPTMKLPGATGAMLFDRAEMQRLAAERAAS